MMSHLSAVVRIPPGSSIFSLRVLWSILWALVPSAFINVYITGLNQVKESHFVREHLRLGEF